VYFSSKNKTTADTSTVKNELISHRKTPYVGSQQAATKQYVTLSTHQGDMTFLTQSRPTYEDTETSHVKMTVNKQYIGKTIRSKQDFSQ
jgi:hypothetical protein